MEATQEVFQDVGQFLGDILKPCPSIAIEYSVYSNISNTG